MSLSIQENVAKVHSQIDAAASRAGRDARDVTLVAVSKTFGPEVVREAADAGLSVFGENKVQEALAKIEASPGYVSWHLVGHLQSNKVKHAVSAFDMIQSVDSIKLLGSIDAAARDSGKVMPVLIQVNVAEEASKFGVAPRDLHAILGASLDLMNVEIRGLMLIPPYTEDEGEGRKYFSQLRELRDECTAVSGLELSELSMGMSHDFEMAIEEGATMVRVGEALFGKRKSRISRT